MCIIHTRSEIKNDEKKRIEMGSKEDHTQPETRRFVDLHPYAHAIEDPRLMQGFTHPPGQLNHS